MYVFCSITQLSCFLQFRLLCVLFVGDCYYYLYLLGVRLGLMEMCPTVHLLFESKIQYFIFHDVGFGFCV